jgi:ABC-2 type transport system permease protein
VLVLTLIAVIAGVAFAATGMLLAFRAKNASTVQGIFPLVFVVLFVSSAFFPRELLQSPASWLADYNPLSYIAEGIRDPIISEISAGPVLAGLAAAIGLAIVMAALAIAALRTRLGDA